MYTFSSIVLILNEYGISLSNDMVYRAYVSLHVLVVIQSSTATQEAHGREIYRLYGSSSSSMFHQYKKMSALH